MKAAIAVAFTCLLATSAAYASLPPEYIGKPATAVVYIGQQQQNLVYAGVLKKGPRLKSEAQLSEERLAANVAAAREYLNSPEGAEDLASYLSEKMAEQVAELYGTEAATEFASAYPQPEE